MTPRSGRIVLLVAVMILLAACRGAGGPRITSAPAPLRTPNASDLLRNEALGSLEVFITLLASEDRAFRIDQESTISTPVGTVLGTYRMDVVGEDVQGDLRLSGAGLEPARVRFVIVGNGLWVRYDSAAWKKVPRGTLTASDGLEILQAGVVARHLEFRGTRTVNGTTLYHFRSRAPIPYVTDASETPGSITELDIFILEDGTPVSVEVENTGIVQLVASIKGRVTVDSTLQFSRVGKPVRIEPPA